MITKQQVIDEAAIKAPYELGEGFIFAAQNAEKLITQMKSMGTSGGSPSKLAKETNELTDSQAELEKILLQVEKAQAKNTQEVADATKELNRQRTSLKEKVLLGERDAKTVNAQNSSYTQLEAALRKNQRAYKELATEEQRASKEGQELLAIINKQDKEFKELSDQMKITNVHVGDYKNQIGLAGNAAQAVVPGLHGMAAGIQSATKASLAFVATPLGATLAAIALVLGPVISFFTSHGEGMDTVTRISTQLNNVWRVTQDRINGLGKALIETTESGIGKFLKQMALVLPVTQSFTLSIKAIELIFPKFIKDLQEAAKAGQVYADTMDEIETNQRFFNFELAKESNEIQKLILQSKDRTKSEKERLALIDQALDREKKLSDQKVLLARQELDALTKNASELSGITIKAGEDSLVFADRLARALDGTSFEDFSISISEGLTKLFNAEGESIGILEKLQNKRNELIDKADEKEAKRREEKKKQDEEDAKNTLEVNRLQLATQEELRKLAIEDQKKANEEELRLLQERIDNEANRIKQAVINKNITREEAEKQLAAFLKSQGDEIINQQIAGLQKLLALDTLNFEERAAIEKQLYALKNNLVDAYYNQVESKQKTSLEKQLEENTKFLTQVRDIYASAGGSITDIFAGITERRIQDIDAEMAKLEEATAREIELAGNNEAAKAEIEARAEEKRKVLEDKKRAEQQRVARADKAFALVGAAINTALSITKTLATLGVPAGIPAAALAGVLGALQIAAIAAKPIPQFEVGTRNAPGGLAVVGEAGSELIQTPSGRFSLTPNAATLVDLPKGSKVFTNDETMGMLAMAGIGETNFTNGISLAQLIAQMEKSNKENADRIVSASSKRENFTKKGSLLYKVIEDQGMNTKLIRQSVTR